MREKSQKDRESAVQGDTSALYEAMGEPFASRLREICDTAARSRERLYREKLVRAVKVLDRTRHAFHSKQLQELREEIERILES